MNERLFDKLKGKLLIILLVQYLVESNCKVSLFQHAQALISFAHVTHKDTNALL